MPIDRVSFFKLKNQLFLLKLITIKLVNKKSYHFQLAQIPFSLHRDLAQGLKSLT